MHGVSIISRIWSQFNVYRQIISVESSSSRRFHPEQSHFHGRRPCLINLQHANVSAVRIITSIIFFTRNAIFLVKPQRRTAVLLDMCSNLHSFRTNQKIFCLVNPVSVGILMKKLGNELVRVERNMFIFTAGGRCSRPKPRRRRWGSHAGDLVVEVLCNSTLAVGLGEPACDVHGGSGALNPLRKNRPSRNIFVSTLCPKT